MKVTTTTTLFATYIFVQQAAATYNWGAAKSFSNPANTNNECTQDQKSGFDWSDLPIGDFGSYKGFDFAGFSCSNSDEKRSLRTRTGTKGKYIQSTAKKNAETAPKISCSTGKDFSITEMEVATSFDTDIDFVYDMPDGSSCKQTESCSKGGSNVKNSQCGGAVSVSFKIPQYGSDDDCEVEIDSVGFDCQPASPPIPSSTTPEITSTAVASSSEIQSSAETSAELSSAAESTIPASSTDTTPLSSTSELASSIPSVESSLTVVEPTSSDNLSIAFSSTVDTPTVPPTTAIDPSVTMTTSTVFSTFTSTTLACSSEIPDCPANSLKIVTMTTAVSTTICPVTSVASSSPETSNPALETLESGPETSAPALETSAPAPEVSQPVPQTETAPAESIPTSVLPVPTSVAESSSTSVTLSIVPEASTAISVPSGGSIAIPETLATTPATSDIITTEIIFTTTTLCPVTLTSTSGSSTFTTTSLTLTQTVITSTATVCTKCTEAPPTTLTPASATSIPALPATMPSPESTITESSSVPAATSVSPGSGPSDEPAEASNAPCPEVLPSCLNTWLSLVPTCSSNSDASCYCPSKEFTDAVIGCVQAWGASTDEMSAALSYFTGICAASVSENPAIITAVPSTITICPTAGIPTDTVVVAASTPAETIPGETVPPSTLVTSPISSIVQSVPPSQIPQMPVTVISYTQTVIPSSPEAVPSVLTSAVTVPQVSFITNTGLPATPVSAGGVVPQAITSVGLVPAAITTAVALPTVSGAGAGVGAGSFNGTSIRPGAATSSVLAFTGAAARFDAAGTGTGVAVAAAALAGMAALFI